MAKFDLITTLTLNATGFEGGINKAKAKTKELSENIKGSTDILGSLGSAMGGITSEMTSALSSMAGAATGIGLVVIAVGLLASAFKTAKENVDLYLASVDKSKQGEGIFTKQAGDIISKNIKREAGGVTAERMIELKTGAEMFAIDVKISAARIAGNNALVKELEATRAILKEQNEQAHAQEKINQGLVNNERNIGNRIKNELEIKKILADQFKLQKEAVQESVANAAIEEKLKKDRAIITDKSGEYSVKDKKAALVEYETTANSYAKKREDLIDREIANTKALGEFTKVDGEYSMETINAVAALETEKHNVGKEHWAEEVAQNRLISRVKKDALADELLAEKKRTDAEKAFHDLKMKNLLIEGGGTGVKVGGEVYVGGKLQKAGEADTSNVKAKNIDFGFGSAAKSQLTSADKALKGYNGTLASTLALNLKYAESQERINDALQSFADSVSQGADSFKEFAKIVANSIRQVISALLSKTIAEAIAKAMDTAKNPFIGLALGAIAGGLAATLFNSIVPKFSQGGIVGGTSYSGDNVPAMLNSGERVLTMNQQANMFGGGVLTTKVSGTDLMIVLNNTMRKNNSFA